MGRLIDISDDRFWKILFDEACVEGQQADRINDELEEIVAYDVEAVVKQIEENAFPDFEEEYSCNGEQLVWLSDVLDIVRKGGVKNA